MEQLHKDSGAPPRSQHEFAFALGGGGDSRQLRLLHVVIFATIPVVLITTIITWSTWSFAASRITKEINANRDLLRDLAKEIQEINAQLGYRGGCNETNETPTCIDASAGGRGVINPINHPHNAKSALNEQLKQSEFKASYTVEKHCGGEVQGDAGGEGNGEQTPVVVYKGILTYRIHEPEPGRTYVFEGWGESEKEKDSESDVKKVAEQATAFKALRCLYPDVAEGMLEPEGHVWHMDPPKC